MKNLINNIEKNYADIKISSIKKIKEKSINDIFFINDKYVLKVFNVDNIKQVITSVKTQKVIHDTLKITPKVITNNLGVITTEYENKIYCIQEFIQNQTSSMDIIEKVASELYLMHEEFRKLDPKEYKFEKKEKNYCEIEKEITDSLQVICEKELDREDKNYFKELIEKRYRLLKKYKCEYKPKDYQIIHGDVRLSNIICRNDIAYFIDFDFTSYGDLLFEIGSAAMLIANFEPDEAKRFIEQYNSCAGLEKYDTNEIFTNLLSYYVQSNFPIRLIGKIDNKAIREIVEGRLNCLEFCNKVLESE